MLFWRHLVLLVLGVACQVFALLFPRVAVPLVSAGTMLLALVDLRSVLGGPTPGPFPLRTPGASGPAGMPGPGTRVALLLFAGLSSLLYLPSCATTGPLGAAEVCGEAAMFNAVGRIYPTLLDDLTRNDWTTAPATLEAQIGPTGADIVTCALQYAVAESQTHAVPVPTGQSLLPADDPVRWRTIHDRAQKLLDQRAQSIPMPAAAHPVST